MNSETFMKSVCRMCQEAGACGHASPIAKRRISPIKVTTPVAQNRAFAIPSRSKSKSRRSRSKSPQESNVPFQELRVLEAASNIEQRINQDLSTLLKRSVTYNYEMPLEQQFSPAELKRVNKYFENEARSISSERSSIVTKVKAPRKKKQEEPMKRVLDQDTYVFGSALDYLLGPMQETPDFLKDFMPPKKTLSNPPLPLDRISKSKSKSKSSSRSISKSCEEKLGKACPSGKHYSKTCRCITNVRKPYTRKPKGSASKVDVIELD